VPSAVLGDFLAAADEHIAAAVLADDNPVSRFAAQDLCHLVMVLERYCGDLAPCDEVEASGRGDLHPWERAVIDADAALRIAGDCLRRGAPEAARDQPGTAPRTAPHLAAAATQLMAGRDLLHTHLVTDPAGLARDRSEWAPVVTSLPVLRALANEIGRWSRQLAPLPTLLASSAAQHGARRGDGQDASDMTAHLDFASASGWLQAAGAAVRTALDIDPVRTSDTELLYAVPAAMTPQRQRPDPAGESVAELCDGIVVSASRLRGAMRDSAERARWSPDVTSGGWQWMAQAAAVTCHLSELALRSLATRASQLSSPPASETQLDTAADFMTGMRAAWQQVDRLWDGMITERKLRPTSAMTDASDLVLRLGRLVWDNPYWTPARAQRARLRPPSVMAPGAADFNAVVAAAHQAIDALAVVAKADGQGVEAASAAGRLYVPTRSLPGEYYDVPRPFAPAPITRCQALHEAYGAVLDATTTAARALDELAVAAGAPSKALAPARAAALAQAHRPGSQNRPDDDIPPGRLPDGVPSWESRTSTGRTGPVEQAIRDRGISDPIILLRAAAIDNAAWRLITQAGNAAGVPGRSSTRKRQRHDAGTPAQLAAQSFPHNQAARASNVQPSRSAGQTPISGIRVKR
jgi:hypothetical protein